jgi:hypothetical protein
MKFRMFALIVIVALSLAGWAQETPAAPAAPNSTPAPQAKSCCHHNMADMKDGKSCCHHGAADAKDKDAASCCGNGKCEMKDGKSCCQGKDMKAAMAQCKKNGCCTDGKCCGEGKCCGAAKDGKTAMGCCGNKCERQPQTPAAS